MATLTVTSTAMLKLRSFVILPVLLEAMTEEEVG